jgi:hypothetical protein
MEFKQVIGHKFWVQVQELSSACGGLMGIGAQRSWLSRDAFKHHHGTGAEGTWRLAGDSGGRIGAWFCAKQRAAVLERSSTAAVGEQAEVADAVSKLAGTPG